MSALFAKEEKSTVKPVIYVLIALICVGVLSGCARPVGDFGRAAPSFTHDKLLPTVGYLRASIFKEPASNLNWTDEENEMHDRVWRFLIAPHAHDWFYNILVEWQRTRLLPPLDERFKYDRYYAYLRTQEFASSKIRYSRLSRDIEADLDTSPGVFIAICAVLEINRRRNEAARSLPSAGPIERAEVAERQAENAVFIQWFVRALSYRYESYSLALERLLIETPHEGARAVNGRLNVMAIDVERAERGAFCSDGKAAKGEATIGILKSRMTTSPFSPGPKYRK